MNHLRGIAQAWVDADAATPRQRVAVLLLLIALLLAAAVRW